MSKAERVHQYHENTLKALQALIQAAGLQHPNDVTPAHIVRRVNQQEIHLLSNTLMQVQSGALLNEDLSTMPGIFGRYWPMAQADSFHCAPH